MISGHSQSCSNNTNCKRTKEHKFSWLPAIIIAVLPKCPFCIMAYSGAVSMCSGKMLFPNADAYSGYIIVGLSLLVLFGILLNNKGMRTWFATLIASLGIILLIISQFFYLSQSIYYLACFVLFFGIWFNGSFGYFYNKFIRQSSNSFNQT